MSARSLKAVPDFPPTDSPVVHSVVSAAADSRRALLVALRDRIAADIDEGVPPRDLASLSRRLMELATEIEKLDSEGGGAVGDAAETPDEGFDASSI